MSAQIKIVTMRCSACNKRFTIVATTDKIAKCRCGESYILKDGTWHWHATTRKRK